MVVLDKHKSKKYQTAEPFFSLNPGDSIYSCQWFRIYALPFFLRRMQCVEITLELWLFSKFNPATAGQWHCLGSHEFNTGPPKWQGQSEKPLLCWEA